MSKKWLNSESQVLKVVCMCFKVHHMRNIWVTFRNNQIKIRTSKSGCFWLFFGNFRKKWLTSESQELKVVCMWFKVHSMWNMWVSFRNNQKKIKTSKSGCFWLFLANCRKNGWILYHKYQKWYACGLKFIICGIYEFLSEIINLKSEHQNPAVVGFFS